MEWGQDGGRDGGRAGAWGGGRRTRSAGRRVAEPAPGPEHTPRFLCLCILHGTASTPSPPPHQLLVLGHVDGQLKGLAPARVLGWRLDRRLALERVAHKQPAGWQGGPRGSIQALGLLAFGLTSFSRGRWCGMHGDRSATDAGWRRHAATMPACRRATAQSGLVPVMQAAHVAIAAPQLWASSLHEGGGLGEEVHARHLRVVECRVRVMATVAWCRLQAAWRQKQACNGRRLPPRWRCG